MSVLESRIIRWIRSLAVRNVSSRITSNRNNNASKEFDFMLLSQEGDPDFVLEERSRLLIQAGDFDQAVSVLESINISQGQQLMLGECYFELGRIQDGLRCSATLMELLTSHQRPKANELMKLVQAYLASSYNFRALLLLRCTAKLYVLEAREKNDTLGSLAAIEKCSYDCFCLIDNMIEQGDYHHVVAEEYGPDFIVEILDFFREIKVTPQSVEKIELEAKIMNNVGLCYRCIKCYSPAKRYLQDGISLMRNKNISTISYQQTLGNLLRNLGLLLHDEQSRSAAQSLYMESLEAFGKAEKLRACAKL